VGAERGSDLQELEHGLELLHEHVDLDGPGGHVEVDLHGI
jgi:hypothetical protein